MKNLRKGFTKIILIAILGSAVVIVAVAVILNGDLSKKSDSSGFTTNATTNDNIISDNDISLENNNIRNDTINPSSSKKSDGDLPSASDIYSVEEVFGNDLLKYRGASRSAVKPYIVKGYLVKKELGDCSPCLSADESLCAPCFAGRIVIAPASQIDSLDVLAVDVDPNRKSLEDKLRSLEQNKIYSFMLQPGQNNPELVDIP